MRPAKSCYSRIDCEAESLGRASNAIRFHRLRRCCCPIRPEGDGLGFQSRIALRSPVRGGQELEGNEAIELLVTCFINHAHPTTTQLLDDAVVRDGFADHGRECYVGVVSESMKARSGLAGFSELGSRCRSRLDEHSSFLRLSLILPPQNPFIRSSRRPLRADTRGGRKTGSTV